MASILRAAASRQVVAKIHQYSFQQNELWQTVISRHMEPARYLVISWQSKGYKATVISAKLENAISTSTHSYLTGAE
jgi:hypothetical protein